jgi:hypothetical protein
MPKSLHNAEIDQHFDRILEKHGIEKIKGQFICEIRGKIDLKNKAKMPICRVLKVQEK